MKIQDIQAGIDEAEGTLTLLETELSKEKLSDVRAVRREVIGLRVETIGLGARAKRDSSTFRLAKEAAALLEGLSSRAATLESILSLFDRKARTMSTFIKARGQHEILARHGRHSESRAADLWAAITGVGVSPPGSVSEAIRDTVPSQFATLLATDDVAAVYAFELMESIYAIGNSLEIRDRVRAQWSVFSERAEQTKVIAEGFGWDMSAAWAQTRDVSTDRDAEMVSRIARLAGRMFASLKGARARKVNGVPGEVHSIEQGGNVGRMLPAELVQLMDANFETPVLHRISVGRALQYAVRGTDRKAKGPLVLALDESGSMHGERNEWAKAAALALARVAALDKRAVVVVHYSRSVVVQALRPNDPASVMSMIKHFLSGGTAIGLALTNAVDQVKALASRGDKGADIVLVTDGIDHDTEAHVEAMDAAKAIGARVWTVAIECAIPSDAALRAGAAQYTELGGAQMRDGASVTKLSAAA